MSTTSLSSVKGIHIIGIILSPQLTLMVITRLLTSVHFQRNKVKRDVSFSFVRAIVEAWQHAGHVKVHLIRQVVYQQDKK